MIARLLVVLGMLALAGSAAVLGPASASPAAPPDDTFEVAIAGGVVVAPGGTITFTGICWSSVLGAAGQALVHGSRHVPLGSDIEPYDFSITVTPNQNTGSFSGTVSVPGDAPNGAYGLSVLCYTQDQALGRGETPFTIDGPQVATTTTTTSPSTTVPSTTVPSPTAPPVAARPVSGTATLAG